MSFDLENHGVWVLEPYCFCRDREWLTIGNVRYTGGEDGDGEHGGVLKRIPGLSDDETALLAALLTALAIFLFLLMLLLCLLCPCWCCCGRNGVCCASKKRSSSTDRKAHNVSNTSAANDVNLTAVDMKIPRPWMENYEGFSDSELTKKKVSHGKGKLWEDTDIGRFGVTNAAYNDDVINDSGWFSSHDLDSVYDQASLRGTTRLDKTGHSEFYRGATFDRKNTARSTMTRCKSSSYNDLIETLMSPHPISAYRAHRTRTGSDVSDSVYATTASQRRETRTDTGVGGQTHFVDVLTQTGCQVKKSTNGHNTGFKDPSEDVTQGDKRLATNSEGRVQSSHSTQAPPLPPYSSLSPAFDRNVTPSIFQTQNGNILRDAMLSQPGNIISEVTSAYKRRVVEETEETTTI